VPEYTYVGDEGRVYPSLPPPANGPQVGSTYTLEKAPGDNRWSVLVPKKKPAPEAPAPAGEPTNQE
jgi:hypothetical protein